MRQMPSITLNTSGNVSVTAPPQAHPATYSGDISGVTPTLPIMGVRRDFTYTPLFNPALTINGQTGVPRG